MIKAFILYDIKPKDVPLYSEIKNKITLKELMRYNNSTDIIEDSIIGSLYKIGYKIIDQKSLNSFLDITGLKDITGRYVGMYASILKLYDIVKKYDESGAKLIMDHINNNLNSLIQKESGVSRLDISRYSAMNIDLNYYELSKLKNNIEKNHPNIWERIYNIARECILHKPSEFRTSSEEGRWEYGIEKTIDFLNFFNVTKKEFDEMASKSKDGIFGIFISIFERLSSYQLDKFMTYLNTIGYNFIESEKVSLLKKIVDDIDIDFYEYLISKNLEADKSYESIIKLISDKRSVKNENSLVKLFSNSKYKNTLDETLSKIKNRELFDRVRTDLDRAFSRGDIKDWYEKDFDNYINIKDDAQGHIISYRDKEKDFKVLLILNKLDKLDDADKIGYNLMGHSYASFHQHLLHALCKVISGVRVSFNEITNLKYTEEDRKRLYEWVISKVDESDIKNQKYLQVCYYLFDRKKFDKFLNSVKTIKDNLVEHYTSRKTKEELTRPKTNRIYELRYILSYLASSNNEEEFKRIVDTILNNKITKTELKSAIYTISNIRVSSDNSRENQQKFEKFQSAFIKELSNRLVPVVRTNSIKESRILSWINFNKLK